ncbi:MAG: hypothetical protein JWM93_3991 [Frankiales bacterium]|nr:hypothetical protein [Frankiales bacterium]
MIDTRAHLAWAKQRALEYLDAGDVPNAVASWMSDLRKHEQLADHASIELIGMHALSGQLNERTARELIEGSR